MEETINVELLTKYGERLYIVPVSYDLSPYFYDENHNLKCFIYPREGKPYQDYQYYSFFDNVRLVFFKLKYGVNEVINDLTNNFFDLFNVFHPYHKYFQFVIDLDLLNYYLFRQYAFMASDVFDGYISVKGQLWLSNCDYVDNYLIPSNEYLEERLAEWLEEVEKINIDDDMDENDKDIVLWKKEIAFNYRKWKEKQLELNREIYYLCSFDT